MIFVIGNDGFRTNIQRFNSSLFHALNNNVNEFRHTFFSIYSFTSHTHKHYNITKKHNKIFFFFFIIELCTQLNIVVDSCLNIKLKRIERVKTKQLTSGRQTCLIIFSTQTHKRIRICTLSVLVVTVLHIGHISILWCSLPFYEPRFRVTHTLVDATAWPFQLHTQITFCIRIRSKRERTRMKESKDGRASTHTHSSHIYTFVRRSVLI